MGWSDLVEFAVAREKQNREDLEVVKSRKNGARELNSLVCSINYDRSRVSHVDLHPAVRGSRKKQGDARSYKCRCSHGMCKAFGGVSRRLAVKGMMKKNKINTDMIQETKIRLMSV